MPPYTTDEWREGLRYMNDLYNEGLLAASIFTDDNSQFKATLNLETPVVGLVSAGSYSNWPNAAENSNFLELELMPHLLVPKPCSTAPAPSIPPLRWPLSLVVRQVMQVTDLFSAS